MLGLGAHDGSFHVKAGIVMGERPYFAPGTFVAAVGADDESKQEIEPSLLASAIVVTDITA